MLKIKPTYIFYVLSQFLSVRKHAYLNIFPIPPLIILSCQSTTEHLYFSAEAPALLRKKAAV